VRRVDLASLLLLFMLPSQIAQAHRPNWVCGPVTMPDGTSDGTRICTDLNPLGTQKNGRIVIQNQMLFPERLIPDGGIYERPSKLWEIALDCRAWTSQTLTEDGKPVREERQKAGPESEMNAELQAVCPK